jgi:hypothetical protein
MSPDPFPKVDLQWTQQAHAGIRFQYVVTPDGLFECFLGLITDNQHDLQILARSELIPKLPELIPAQNEPEDIVGAGGGNTTSSRYCDPAFLQSLHIFGGCRNPRA